MAPSVEQQETTADGGLAAPSNAVRPSRSPRRFARLRQTRVASLSPTPTLVAAGAQGSNGSPARTSASRGRRREASSTRFGVAAADGHRMRSVSRARGGSPPHADGEEKKDNAERHDDDRGPGKQSDFGTDVEKGLGSKDPSDGKKQTKSDFKQQSLAERILPHPIPHFLGFRRPASELPPHHRDVKPYASILPFMHHVPVPIENLVWALVGAFVGIAIVELVFTRPRHFTSSTDVPPHAWAAPVIVGSFGASSVLLYASPSSPLSQPRCFVGGQTLSAIVGVAISKLLRLSGPVMYDLQHTDTSSSVVWIAGALATACALVVMMATGTLHPPGGATAVLCATNMEVSRMSWRIVPVVLLSSALMLTWNMLWMNLGRRRYPDKFLIAAPPTFKDGNMLQGLQGLITRMQSKRKPKAADVKTPDDAHNDPARGSPAFARNASASPSSANRAQQHAKANNDNEPWHDETAWKVGSGTNELRGVKEEALDSEEAVERPSRWASSTSVRSVPPAS